MSAIIFMNKSSRENGRKMISGQVGRPRPKRKQNGTFGAKRNYRRGRSPNRHVVTQQPGPSTSINMSQDGSRGWAAQVPTPDPPPTYFCLSVLCFFCCPVFAAFSLFFSSQVMPNHSRGNYIGAKWSSRFAVLFCILSLLTAVGIVICFLYIFGISSTSEAEDFLTSWWHNQFAVE